MQTCTSTSLHVSSRHRFKTSVKTINLPMLVFYSLSLACKIKQHKNEKQKKKTKHLEVHRI